MASRRDNLIKQFTMYAPDQGGPPPRPGSSQQARNRTVRRRAIKPVKPIKSRKMRVR